MYSVKNPARNTRTRTFPLTAWTIIKLVVVCLATASVPYALYVRVDSKDSKAAVTVQAAERGKPYFNFQDGREMRVDYRGEQNLTAALQTGQAQPRSLASTVLRDAAVPDLIAGYAYNGMGIVTVQHGNPDAFAPKDESVYARMQQGYNPDSLLPGADTYLVPENPDFLQVGDFNHDNRKDVLIAGPAGNLFLLPGDGLGRLNAPEQIFLPGRVTALAAGEFRAVDGWTDVAIGVETPAGPALLIYDGDPGLSGEPMSFQLSAPATSLQIAGLDNDPFMDVAVATGSEVNIIHGWGRKQEVSLESRRERINLNNNARDLAAGFFIWNRAGSNQIAVLSDDGTVNVLDQSGSDSRPFTIKETAQMRLSRRIVQKQQPVDVETVVAWQANNAASWNPAREFSAGSSLASAPGSQSLLQRSHVSFLETDDLLLLNGNQNRVDFVRQIDSSSAAQAQSSSTQGDLTTTSLDASDAPVAVLALPQKLNGERNLVMLQQGSALPIIVPMAPTATPTVDRFDDPVGGSLAAASVCGVGGGDCSLRGAVQVANASPGSTITLPAGTYVLSSNGTGAGGCDGNTVGDLGVNQGTTINGAGAGSTIIRQTGTGPANNGDRVMCMNEGFLVGISYSFSGFTVHGGRDSGGLGGGGIIGGEQNNSLTLSGVTISNNQVTGGNLGGGGIQITGGNLTITNCLIGGTLNPVLGDRTTIARGNINNTSTAGGLYFSPSAPQHSPSVGNLVVTGTTIDHNHAFGTGGGGATSEINAFAAPGGIGTGTATYDTTTFNANQASNGGGLLVSSLPTTLGSVAGTVSFTSNTATGFGGGVHVGGGSLHLNGTLATINFASSNTAGGGGPALGGGSVSANGPLTLSGTNTTIGGTAGVFTNGTWTNNAGSAMSPTNFAIVGGTLNCNNSTINVSGNFEIAPEATKGGILNAGSGTINIQGNLNVNLNNGGSGAVGQFNAGTGTFNFNGSAAQSITNVSAFNFFNLTDSNVTQPLTLNNSFGVNGSLNVSGANAIFDPVVATVISGTGTLTGTGTARVRRLGADTFFNQYTITNKTLTNLTVEYIGAAGQTASTTTYGNLKISNPSGVSLNPGNTIVDGTLTLQSGALAVGANTLTINNGITVVGGSLTSGATGTVNYNQGSVGQVVIVANYGNLTFSAFTKVLPSSGTVGIAGTFNPNGISSGHTIIGSTVDFNGTGAQTVPTFNFNNLTISGARTVNSVTLVNGGTIGIAGTFSPTATFTSGNYINTNNTIDFNGTGAQTIPAFNYNNLTISGNRAVAITLGNGNVGVAGTFNPSVTGNTWTPNAANTVVFNGGALQTIPAFAFFNGLTLDNAASANLGGNVTVLNGLTLTAGALGVGSNTLTLNGAVSATAGSLLSGPTGTVNYNQQSDGQATVLAANYGNLTFSNFSKTLAASGTIGILGTFTPGSGTGHTITGSTINFNGTGSQNIPGFTYHNLTSSGPGVARVLDPVNTIKIAAVFTPGTDIYTITGSTVEYNGSAAQTLPSGFTTYNNLILNNPTTVAGFAGLIVQGLLRVQAGTFTSSSSYNNVQIDAGATLAATAGSTINVSGNWTNNGTFTPSTGTVVFNGNDNTQTLSGNTTFNNLTINHTGTGGVTASGSTLAVTGLLLVQGGTFTSSSTFNNVQIDSGATLASDGGTMNVSGNWTNNGGTFTPSTGIVNFNGAAAQAINGTAANQTFGNFVVNKSAGALSAGGSTISITTNNLTMTLGTFTAPATLDINGNTLLTAGTLSAGANITAAGNWTNNGGAFTPGTGTVTFDGGVGQAIGGTTATTFNNLTNGNANGLAMSHDNTVNGILALTSGDITVADTKTLTQPASGSSSGTFDVVGNVQRTGFVNATTFSFGNPNNQITVTSAPATSPTSILVNMARSAPVSFPSAVTRNYTITPTGGTGAVTATLRLHYLDSELNGNTEASLNLRRFNGTGWVPYPSTNADLVDNWVENNIVHDFSQWTFSSLSPTATEGSVSGRIVESDGTPVAGAVVRLNGVQDRKFITDAGGYYRFDNVETGGFYTVTPSRANFSFSPAQRSFSQTGNHTEAAFAASSTGGNENPLETPEYFVRQHYLDFLGREPDEAGFNFWSDQILECGTETNCLQRRRENVSAAYFLSIEFQQTGGLVDGLYKASYGVRPQFAEFMPDTRAVARDVVVGRTGWEAKLEANKQAFVDAFVQRPTFVGVYGNMANDAYVDALISHTGVSFTSAERDPLVSGLADGTLTRAAVLRRIAEEGRFVNAKFNEAFVMMEYFGYLRRNPDASGFQFWLNKLNQFGGNFEQAEMVEAFIVSGEYRDRFAR